MHCVPCCYICTKCHRNIKAEIFDSHKEQCGKEDSSDDVIKGMDPSDIGC
jgi:hypothetical protein